MLWTAQGRILLDAAARDARHAVGELFAVFWCLFNTSAVLGGFVTFGYFSTQTSSGNAPLYLGFTVLIAAGGAACFLLEDDAVPAARADGPMIDRAAPGAFAELASTVRLFGTKWALCLALSRMFATRITGRCELRYGASGKLFLDFACLNSGLEPRVIFETIASVLGVDLPIWLHKGKAQVPTVPMNRQT